MTPVDESTPILLANYFFLVLSLLITKASRHHWLLIFVFQAAFLNAQKVKTLEEVEIGIKSLKEKKFGVSKRNPGLHFIDGIANQKSNFEIAQLFIFPSVPTRITSLNIYLQNSLSDSVAFRINFYRFDGSTPDEQLPQKSIVQKKEVKAGWLKLDLRKESVYLKGEAIISLEFISSQKPNEYLDFEVKLGGKTRTFTRNTKRNEWQRIPHHYVLYATALVSDNPEEELVSAPCHKIYSTVVKDTFSIFVQTPIHATKNKRYPVMYMLDANAYFDEIGHHLRISELKKKPEAILVGIGYKNPYEMDSLRSRDYTYPEGLSSDSCKHCGKADKFYDFIKHELIPFINKVYQTDTNETMLMGHSLGGYYVLYALLRNMRENRGIFSHYASISPSLEYHHMYLIHEYKNSGNIALPTKLFLAFGDKEEGKEDFENFTKTLNAIKNLEVKSKIIPKADHMETSLPSFTKAADLFLRAN